MKKKDMEGTIKLTNFSLRHFDRKFGGTKITDFTPEEFEKRINTVLVEDVLSGFSVQNGYADFCKIISFPNFTRSRVGVMEITIENYQYLRSGYSARRDGELAVLSRWFDLPLGAPVAEWLQVVCYSREQLFEEHKAEGGKVKDFELTKNDKWGVVAILAQSTKKTDPMKPITMLRNALGKEEGGSGVPIDREKYEESVAFWSRHATVK